MMAEGEEHDIFVVQTTAVVREGLTNMINQEVTRRVCGQAETVGPKSLTAVLSLRLWISLGSMSGLYY